MNFDIEKCIANDKVSLVAASKKLKTRPVDFESLKNTTVPVEIEVKEEVKPISTPEPVKYSFEKEDKKDSTMNIDEIVNKRIKEKEEKPEEEKPVEEKMDDNIEFAYAGRVAKPEVSEEEITRIKSLEDTYKGENHPSVSSIPIKAEVEEYSEKEYLALLKTTGYSPRTKKYLDSKQREYQSIIDKIENVKNEIDQITDKYKIESEIASKLNAIKKETYGIMTWINSSDFKVLKNEKTAAVNNLFKSYEELFNENQTKFKKADEELEKTNEITSSLGKQEKSAREELQRLTKKKKQLVKENYKKVEEVIELDENMRKQANEMTALTGIDEIDSAINSDNKFEALRTDE